MSNGIPSNRQIARAVAEYEYAKAYRSRKPLATTDQFVTENARVSTFRRAVAERLNWAMDATTDFLDLVAVAFRKGYQAGQSDGYDQGSRDGDYTSLMRKDEEITRLNQALTNAQVESQGHVVEIDTLQSELATEREENDDLRRLLRECTDREGTDALRQQIARLSDRVGQLQAARMIDPTTGETVSKTVYDDVVDRLSHAVTSRDALAERLKEMLKEIEGLKFEKDVAQSAVNRYLTFYTTVTDAVDALRAEEES